MKDRDFWKKLIKENSFLNPVDRISEILFGLIMVLTFTGAISVSNDGREEVRELLWAALGCNLAWGFVDAVMYLMNLVTERGHALKVINELRDAKSEERMAETIKEEIPPLLSSLLSEKELSDLGERIKSLPPPSGKNLLSFSDGLVGLQIFFLVFLCTLPVALPFLFIGEVGTALKISNAVALALLFAGGFILARYAGFRPVLTAVVYTLIGVFLVFLTKLLGG